MPLLRLKTSVTILEEKKQELLKALSLIVAETTGKPEQYVMVTLEGAAVMMAGTCEPAAYVDVKSIGSINSKINNDLSKRIADCLHSKIGISPKRVYITFIDVPATEWGWNGATFG